MRREMNMIEIEREREREMCGWVGGWVFKLPTQ